MQRKRNTPLVTQAPPVSDLTDTERLQLRQLRTEMGWVVLESIVADLLSQAIAANMRLQTAESHAYCIGRYEALADVMNIPTQDEEPLPAIELLKRIDPAGRGWLSRFKDQCKHPRARRWHNAETNTHHITCASCGDSWQEENVGSTSEEAIKEEAPKEGREEGRQEG